MFPNQLFPIPVFPTQVFPHRYETPYIPADRIGWAGGVVSRVAWGSDGASVVARLEWSGAVPAALRWDGYCDKGGRIVTGLEWSGGVATGLAWGDYPGSSLALLAWGGAVATGLSWWGGGDSYPGDTNVQEETKPVRRMNPVTADYTYKEPDDTVIDLTPYAGVALAVKRQGGTYTFLTDGVSFSGPKTGGRVLAAGVVFTQVGAWDIQFVCYASTPDEEGARWGDPLRFDVAKNVNDLELEERAD